MSALYDQNFDLQSCELKNHKLGHVSITLRQQSRHNSRVSPLVFMTDPERVPDLPTTIAALPQGCAVIYRHFGQAGRIREAKLLRTATQEAGQQLLIGGGDVELALSVGADGVHFKRDAALVGPLSLRADHPNMLITMAGLKGAGLKGAGLKEQNQTYQKPLTCLDGLFISSIFESNSPSAGKPIGIDALKQICEDLPVPVFALGGITQKTAPRLLGTGVSGLAAIGGLISGGLIN